MADFVLTLNSDEQLLPIGRRFTGPQAESDSVVRIRAVLATIQQSLPDTFS